MEHDLVDEYRLMVFPVVLGSGARLFPESPDKLTLELTDTKTFETGVQVNTYRPAAARRRDAVRRNAADAVTRRWKSVPELS